MKLIKYFKNQDLWNRSKKFKHRAYPQIHDSDRLRRL